MSAAVKQTPQLVIKLNVVKGPHTGQQYQFNKAQITIGRGPENDVVLLNDPQVSRMHAQIILVERDIEIVNLSKKNAVFVNGENVDKWKLVNNETFIIGDSEFKIEYDLGQAVASVPEKKLAEVVALKPRPASAAQIVAAAHNKAAIVKGSPNQVATAGPRAVGKPIVSPQMRPLFSAPPPMGSLPPPPQKKESLLQNPRFKFYAIVAIILGGFLFFVLSPKKVSTTKPKSILKYEDEIAIKLNSTTEKDLVKKREDLRKEMNTPQRQRADENFVKGMRDFHLGNYARSSDFFQVVLNLQPDHALARRHFYLAKVRFDELVQAKLMLGESSYKKHNFRMCESLYRQVKDMLGDRKSNDPKYKLADSRSQECALAAEGIR